MRTYVFLDLDDDIFQFGSNGHAHARGACAANRQRALLRLLGASATIIPITARGFDAFRRMDLPFHYLAILNFGGVVLLPDGSLDPDWEAVIRPQAVGMAEELRTIQESLQRSLDERKLGATM